MFGRRRRNAPVIQAPVAPAPPELSREQTFEHLHNALADLIGPNGSWTLVPRDAADTDMIFHGLKAQQIAGALTEILANETVRLRTVETLVAANVSEPSVDTLAGGLGLGGTVPVSTGALLVASGAEPAALPWNPSPISVWAEPTTGAARPAARTIGAKKSGRVVA